MFQGRRGCFKEVEDVSRKFQGNFKGVSRKCQVRLEGVRSSFKGV